MTNATAVVLAQATRLAPAAFRNIPLATRDPEATRSINLPVAMSTGRSQTAVAETACSFCFFGFLVLDPGWGT